MSILLAVDPSIKSSGVALFRGDQLIAASRLTIPDSIRVDTITDCVEMVNRIVKWAKGGSPNIRTPDELACEWPQIYRESKSKGSPNGLLGLAAICCGVAVALPLKRKPSAYKPDEWTQQVPKATRGDAKNSPRAHRISSRLNLPGESGVWGRVRSHDAIDAIGIGLHHLGRLGRRRVFHGAR